MDMKSKKPVNLKFDLPDFSKCIDFKRLEIEMGIVKIPPLPEVVFEKPVEQKKKIYAYDPSDLKLDKKLMEGIEINIKGLAGDDNGFLVHKGRKVVAYIRDQRIGIDYDKLKSTYKYHLCFCEKLREMEHEGKKRRYVVARKNVNKFSINDISQDPPKPFIVEMELCGYCRKILMRKKMYSNNFTLFEYFKKYDSYIPKRFSKVETIVKIQSYQPNQKELSRRYKKIVNYTCEACGLNCELEKHLLHLHHIDGDKSHNHPHNLRILCVYCHSQQKNHDHIAREFANEIFMIQALRKKQGFIKLGI